MPVHGWVGGDVSADASGNGVLCLEPGGQEHGGRMGVLHINTCQFHSDSTITTLKAAAAWHPRRTVYAAFSQRASQANERHVALFNCKGQVRILHLTRGTMLCRS